MTAYEVFYDLSGILPDSAAEGWIEAGRESRTLADDRRDPWAGGKDFKDIPGLELVDYKES